MSKMPAIRILLVADGISPSPLVNPNLPKVSKIVASRALPAQPPSPELLPLPSRRRHAHITKVRTGRTGRFVGSVFSTRHTIVGIEVLLPEAPFLPYDLSYVMTKALVSRS
jgi:hypothetical protein